MASKPDPKIAVAKQTVDTIVSHLERGFQSFNISEIIKGGSLGHGTAVPGDYDIDLVIYSRDVKPDDMLQSKLQPLLLLLHEFLKTTFSQVYTYTGMTQHSLQFDFLCDGCTLAVDLLLSPYWENQHHFYRFLMTVRPQERKLYMAQCSHVKEYIRRAKAWRNEKWPKGVAVEGRPSSYLMSLLVLKAYEIRGRHKTITDALIQLVQSPQIDVYWADGFQHFYKRSDYPHILPSRPRVIDPANPANNVWVSGIKEYRRGENPRNYESEDGNPTLLKQYISSIDLSQPIRM